MTVSFSISPTLRSRALIALALLAAPTVHAQASRTWVSGVGDDANPCSRTAPCKTFAGAISKTAAKGEISVLDPGGYEWTFGDYVPGSTSGGPASAAIPSR